MSIIAKDPQNFHEMNENLRETVDSLHQKTQELGDAREKYLLAKAKYDHDQARFLLESKLREPSSTQSEIKANSICLASESRIESIKAESNFKRLKEEIRFLENKLDAEKEQSYNLRREASI